jgi:hypothetical protein
MKTLVGFSRASLARAGGADSSPCVRRHVLAAVIGLCALAGGLTFSSAPAFANNAHVFSRSFGTGAGGEGAGELKEPKAVAVNDETHDVYVADTGNARVDQFDSSGSFIRSWGWGVADGLPAFETCTLTCQKGISGSGLGQFETPTFIAVDNSSGGEGDVYVADTATKLVQKFDSSGGLIESWGVKGQLAESSVANGPLGELGGLTVDSSGNLWVLGGGAEQLPNPHMFEFGQAGGFIQAWEAPNFLSAGIAVDGEGDLYVGDSFGEVVKLTAGGERIGPVTPPEFEGAPPATGLAVDSATNSLYVDFGTTIEQFSHACDPAQGLLCPIVETFGSPQLVGGAGLAVDAASGAVYAADATAGVVDEFGAAISATTGLASSVLAGSATVEGSVNPLGSPVVECEFEYGTSLAYGASEPCAETVGSGTGEVKVHADLSHLQSGSTYHYRLVARNAATGIAGDDASFPTLPRAKIDGATAANLTPTSADLSAQINPEGLPVESCVFEYGTEAGVYPTKLECAPTPAQIGSGTTPVPITRHIEPLSANVTYHWRVVATDINGVSASPDHTFIYTTAGGGLPDHRAYELVTPPEKNAALIGATFSGFLTKVSEDGSRMMAASIQCFAGSRSCVGARGGQGALFEFARTATGWVTSPLSPPADQFETSTGLAMNPNTAGTALFSGPTTAGGPDHLLARAPDGSFAATGPIASHEVGDAYFQPDPLVSTLDLSHIVYGTNRPEWPPSFDAGHEGSLYEYTSFAQKEPILVGVTGGAGSHDLISVCGTEFGGGGTAVRAEYGSLASDGRTVYFTAKRCKSGSGANEHTEVPADELYARIDQSRTVKVSERVPASCSKPACVGSPPANAAFQGASGDGSRVFFTSTQRLTDEATEDPHSGDSATVPGCPHTAEGTTGCNLYESECPDHCEDPSQRQVIDVSAGDTSGGGPRVQGVVAIAPDGSHVYFVAKGVLTGTANSQGQRARGGGDNLYMFSRSPGQQGGQIAFVATLLPSDEKRQWGTGVEQSNVTPEGRFLVFTSHAALTGDDSRGEGPAQVFRYDSGSGVLVRVSVGDRGFNDNGNAGVGDASIVPAAHGFIGTSGPARADPTMSHDGSYVFFTSPIGLTPGALNDARVYGGNSSEELANNVYEYHEGRVYLISDGKDVSAAGVDEVGSVELVGSDATGANVFFTTTDRLVPQDTDTQRDFYDARIGGGFPYTPPPQPCGEQSCRGTLPPSAPAVAPGSSTFFGAGNLESPAPVPQVMGKPPTRAQLLAKALKSCHIKRNKQKRKRCEREARKRYGTKARPKAKKGGK